MHKHAVILEKARVELYVKKPGKSFGLLVTDSKGNVLTKLYQSLNKKGYGQTWTIGDFIDKKGKVVYKKLSKRSSKKDSDTVEKPDRGSIRALIRAEIRAALRDAD